MSKDKIKIEKNLKHSSIISFLYPKERSYASPEFGNSLWRSLHYLENCLETKTNSWLCLPASTVTSTEYVLSKYWPTTVFKKFTYMLQVCAKQGLCCFPISSTPTLPTEVAGTLPSPPCHTHINSTPPTAALLLWAPQQIC